MSQFKTITFSLDHFSSILNIKAVPYQGEIRNDVPFKHNIFINDVFKGALSFTSKGWQWNNEIETQTLANAIGDYIFKWYEQLRF